MKRMRNDWADDGRRYGSKLRLGNKININHPFNTNKILWTQFMPIS